LFSWLECLIAESRVSLLMNESNKENIKYNRREERDITGSQKWNWIETVSGFAESVSCFPREK
jgi:hypothetical protein